MNQNQFSLTGSLGKKPKTTGNTQDGKPIVSFSIAQNRKRKDPTTGQMVNAVPQWFYITAFGDLAKLSLDSLKQGDLIHVDGSIRVTRSEPTEENEPQKTYYDFIAKSVHKLESLKYENEPSENSNSEGPSL